MKNKTFINIIQRQLKLQLLSNASKKVKAGVLKQKA